MQKKSSVELEPIVPESEPIMIYMEEVEVQEETKDDKERHLSEKKKLLILIFESNKKGRNINKLPLITIQ